MATTVGGRPAGRLRTIQDALTPREWGKVGAMAGVVVGLNVLGWVMLTAATGHHYHLSKTDVFGLGTGVLAYTLGMRHAFDADHISAIDNTTRKLMADGKRPLSVGFFFSLGHSTIVFLLAVLLNFGIRDLDNQVKSGSSGLHQWTSVIGTSVSGFFLYLIAGLNIVILVSILKVFANLRRGEFDDEELDEQLNKRGLMNRLLGGFARRIDAPWKMYPVGVLFGLGFDTATEVALLVLSGTAVASGLPFYAILSLPVLFAAGMCLFDTLDGCFMNLPTAGRSRGPFGRCTTTSSSRGSRLRWRSSSGPSSSSGSSPPSSTCTAGSGPRWRTSTSTAPGSSSWECSWPPGPWRWLSGVSAISRRDGTSLQPFQGRRPPRRCDWNVASKAWTPSNLRGRRPNRHRMPTPAGATMQAPRGARLPGPPYRRSTAARPSGAVLGAS